MNRLIICGSPRLGGRSAKLASTIFEGCIAEFPDDEVQLVPISELDVKGCTGCGGCNVRFADGARRATGEPAPADGKSVNSASSRNGKTTDGDKNEDNDKISPSARCVIDDDMTYIYEHLDRADEAIVVSPVYFSGAPSQLKAMLDRLQPYYAETADARDEATRQGKQFKTAVKPLTLHILGDGKSPHGYDSLVSEVQSAFAVAGFRLEAIADWVGKISETGEIKGEAQMYALAGGDDGDADDALVGDGTNGALAGDDDSDANDALKSTTQEKLKRNPKTTAN